MNAARYEKSFKALQRINQVAADAIGADDFLSGVLDLMLDIFQCDRAWLLYPCDPDAPAWRVAMERTRPEWPGGLAMNVDFPMTPESAAIYRAISGSSRALKDDAIGELASAAAQFPIKSQLIMAIRPRMDKPWAFGIHHCAQAHRYTEEETELFEEIGRRVAEALNHFVVMGQLRESERYNRMLFENSPIGLTLGRMDGSLLEVNPAFADIVGRSIAEAKELTAWQTSAEGHALQDRQRLQCLSTAARFGPCEDELTHKDGHRVQVQISSNLLEKDGEFYVLSCIEGITKRKQIEEDLRVAAAVFEAHDAIMITDTHANIIRVNKAYSDTTGYSAEEVLGKNPRMMSSGRHDRAFYAAMWQQVMSTGAWEGEIWDRHKNGKIYPKWLTISAVKDERQLVTRYVAIFRDITERKRLENERLRESEERFRGTLEQAAVGIVHATLDGGICASTQNSALS